MNELKPVFCLGDICADLILPFGAAKRAARGEAIAVSQTDVEFRHGGSVANTAAGLRSLGISVMFCGSCGDDAYGYALKNELNRIGCDVSCMRMDSNVPTLLIAIIVDEDGERTAFATHRVHASQHQVTSQQIPEDLCRRIGWLHTGGLLLREEPAASVQLEVMRSCHAAGIPISFDISARMEARGDLTYLQNLKLAAAYSDYILGSVTDELPLLAGDCSEQSIRMLCRGGKVVVARNGDKGAVIYTEGAAFPCPAYSVPVVDTIGAGDAYNAGFIYSLLAGKSFPDANKAANATAAYCVMHKGGRACPSKEALEAFLSEHEAYKTFLCE